MKLSITLDLPQALIDAFNRIAAAVEAQSAVLGYLIEYQRGGDDPATDRKATPAGACERPAPAVTEESPEPEAPASPAPARSPAVTEPPDATPPAAPPQVKKRQMSPEGLAALQANAAAMRERRAARRAAEPAPAPPAPPPAIEPAPIAAPPSPPLTRPSIAPRIDVPLSTTTLDATFATIRKWAGERGLPFDRADDLPAVNAKARRLGLPTFNLVKG